MGGEMDTAEQAALEPSPEGLKRPRILGWKIDKPYHMSVWTGEEAEWFFFETLEELEYVREYLQRWIDERHGVEG
jgi:hypothetical protein